jgi:uncharacterized protein involved in exopolysaccharide biosynthesis
MNARTDSLTQADARVPMGELLRPLVKAWRWLLIVPLLGGAAGFAGSFAVAPTFTAKASFLLPQSPGSAAAAALASLGGLASLAEGAVGSRSPADQYATLMMSVTVADRLIDRFELNKIYETELRSDTRRRLENNTRIVIGRRDGLITVEVDDHDPKRSADMANQYIDELRTLSARLALTEAQQRRMFFEGQMGKAREELLKAQVALQGSGFSAGVLRTEPRAAADNYGRLRSEVAAAEVRLETLRRSLTDSAPEVQRASAQHAALRAQLNRAEQSDTSAAQPEYLARFREFKYRETLFDLFARQYEAARVDEAREGVLIQVVDAATPPERKSRPKRAVVATIAALATLLLLTVGLVVRDRLRTPPADL